MTRSNPYIAYVGDPMCSWCWGFDPVLAALMERLEGKLDVELVLGGLRPGPAARPLDELRDFLRTTWRQIAELTGQAFDERGLERTDWLYDTDPASRAVCAVRSIDPTLALPAFRAVQRAFYADAHDVTDPAALADILSPWVESERFASAYAAASTDSDYRRARSLGARGFPSLFLVREDVAQPLARGYVSWMDLERQIAPLCEPSD